MSKPNNYLNYLFLASPVTSLIIHASSIICRHSYVGLPHSYSLRSLTCKTTSISWLTALGHLFSSGYFARLAGEHLLPVAQDLLLLRRNLLVYSNSCGTCHPAYLSLDFFRCHSSPSHVANDIFWIRQFFVILLNTEPKLVSHGVLLELFGHFVFYTLSSFNVQQDTTNYLRKAQVEQ